MGQGSEHPGTVTILSASPRFRRRCADRLAEAGYAVIAESDGPAGSVEAVVCHVGGTGGEAPVFLEWLRLTHPDACLIVVGRDLGAERTAACLRAGAFDYLTTPVKPGRLEEAVRQGLDVRRSYLQVQELSSQLKTANRDLARERDSLRQWNRHLVLVNELSQLFARTTEPDEIVRALGERLAAIVQFDLLGILWLTPRLAWIRASAHVDAASAERARQALLIANAPTVGQAGPAAHAAVLDLPLTVVNEPCGLLRVERLAGEPFDAHEIELMKAMTTSLALALRNADAHQRLENLAMTDGLTDLPNRRAFGNILTREYREAVRYRTPLCLLMLDVDHFKAVNDRFGHLTGDRLLRDVAGLITQGIRTVDVATRYGGEEFAVILPRTDLAQAEILANRLREAVSRHRFTVDGTRIALTVSIGLAQTPDPRVVTVEGLIARADSALYRAKASGRNRVETTDTDAVPAGLNEPELCRAGQHGH